MARGFRSDRVRWPLVAARDLFELRYGRALIESFRTVGNVPVYGTNGRCGSHDRALFSAPGVILGRKGQGPLGVEWSAVPYWVIDTAYSLAALRPDVDLRYAYYLIKYVGLNHLKDGTSNPTLSRDAFGSQAFPWPSLRDQERIAQVLGGFDDKIELNFRTSGTLRMMARTLFDHWFLRSEASRAWPIEPLADHVEVVRGLSYKGDGLASVGMPLHNLNSVTEGGGYKPDGIKWYTGPYAERHVVEPGDVIVTNTEQGHDRLLIGHAALVPRSFGDLGLFSHHLYRVRPKPGSVLSRSFVAYLLNSPTMHDLISGYSNGTTVQMLPAEALQQPAIPIPSSSMVERFSAIATLVYERDEVLRGESMSLARLRDAFLPRLLSGSIEVKE